MITLAWLPGVPVALIELFYGALYLPHSPWFNPHGITVIVPPYACNPKYAVVHPPSVYRTSCESPMHESYGKYDGKSAPDICRMAGPIRILVQCWYLENNYTFGIDQKSSDTDWNGACYVHKNNYTAKMPIRDEMICGSCTHYFENCCNCCCNCCGYFWCLSAALGCIVGGVLNQDRTLNIL